MNDASAAVKQAPVLSSDMRNTSGSKNQQAMGFVSPVESFWRVAGSSYSH